MSDPDEAERAREQEARSVLSAERAKHADIKRLKCFEVVGRPGSSDKFGAFFIRKQDAETFAKAVNGTVKDSVVTDPGTIGYLLGPRHVPDALYYFLKKRYLQVTDLTIEDRAALMRAFNLKV